MTLTDTPTPKWLRINFNNHLNVKIELLQTPFVDCWWRAFANNLDLKRWNRNNNLLLHSDSHVQATNTEAVDMVEKINSAIRKIEQITGKKWIGYAYPGMGFETTNYLHRGFTTSMITHYRTPALSKELQNEIAMRKLGKITHFQLASIILNHPSVEDFYQIANLGLNSGPELKQALENINAYIHHYEAKYLRSNRANELGFHGNIMQFDYDIKTIGGQLYKEEIYEEEISPDLTNFSFNGSEYNVYALKKILGKDYLTAYFEYDDPTQWDITNMMVIDGTFEIDYNNDYSNIFNSIGYKYWAKHYNLGDVSKFSNYQIGKVSNTEFIDQLKEMQPSNIINNDVSSDTSISETHRLDSTWNIISIETVEGQIYVR